MRKIKYLISSLVVTLLFSTQIFAQHSSTSPFSRFGLGEINNYLTPYNIAMGQTFNTSRSAAHVNFANPASYTATPQQSFLLEFALQNKNSFYKEGNQTGVTSDGNMNFMAAQFPVTKWWSASFGLVPYSNMGYKISHIESLSEGDTAKYSYIGNGGINAVFIGNSFEIAKRLSIGVNANFLYGSNELIRSVSFVYSDYQNSALFKNTIRFHQFNYRVGVQYYDTLAGDWHFSLGATFENKTDLKAFSQLEKVNYMFINGKQFNDTIENYVGDTKIIELPQYLSGGLMIAKGNKLRLQADYYVRDWTNSLFLSKAYDSYTKEYGYSFGSEFIPNLGSPQFWRNLRFRSGVFYKQTNIKIDDSPLMDYGLSLGIGIPIKTSGTIVNAVLSLGKRTTGQATNLTENYANLYINISLGDIWFIKRKFN